MEARRTFQGDAKSSRIWIVVAALLAVIALGLAGGYAAKGVTSKSAPSSAPVVQTGFQGPDAIERNAATYAPGHKHQTVF